MLWIHLPGEVWVALIQYSAHAQISMHQRRAELQVHELGAASNRANTEAERDTLAPLGPASFLLGRARDAANAVCVSRHSEYLPVHRQQDFSTFDFEKGVCIVS